MSKTTPRLPLYLNLYQQLRAKIENGEYPVGAKLPTEMQIAEEYGVSRITSKHALDQLADEGYIHRFAGKGSYIQARDVQSPQPAAPSVPPRPAAAQASRLIGVVMEGIEPNFGIDLLFGIEQRCAELGYSVVIRFSYGDEEREQICIDELLQAGVAGIILMCVYSEVYNPTIMKLALDGFPLVFLDRALNGLPIPYVGTQHRQAALDIMNALIGMGQHHLALAMTEGSTTTSSADDRIQGYVQTCMENNFVCGNKRLLLAFEDILNPKDEVRQENIRRTKEFLLANPETTAFVALTSGIANIVIRALNEMNLQRFVIASFDGPRDQLTLPYDLLYVQQDQKQIGQMACTRLIEKMNQQEVPHATHVPYRLVNCPAFRK